MAQAKRPFTSLAILSPRPYFYATARPEAQQARLQLAQGDVDEVAHWAKSSGLSSLDELTYPYEVDYLTLARVLLAQKNLEAAMSLLTALQEATQADGRQGRLIEVLMMYGNRTFAQMTLDCHIW